MRDVRTDKAVDLGTWIGCKRAFAELAGRWRIRATDRQLPRCALDPTRRSMSVVRLQRTGSID